MSSELEVELMMTSNVLPGGISGSRWVGATHTYNEVERENICSASEPSTTARDLHSLDCGKAQVRPAVPTCLCCCRSFILWFRLFRLSTAAIFMVMMMTLLSSHLGCVRGSAGMKVAVGTWAEIRTPLYGFMVCSKPKTHPTARTNGPPGGYASIHACALNFPTRALLFAHAHFT